MKVEIKKLKQIAIIPQYKTPLSAGFDFHALLDEDCIIPPMSQRKIPTGLAMSIPAGFEIQVRPRSGLAAKYEITITNSPGTIDADYLDEIFLLVYNLCNSPFVVHNGDRIAQGVLKRVEQAEFNVVDDFSDKEKDRGGGFGSTGVL